MRRNSVYIETYKREIDSGEVYQLEKLYIQVQFSSVIQ